MKSSTYRAIMILLPFVALACSVDRGSGGPAPAGSPPAKRAGTAVRSVTGKPIGRSTRPNAPLPVPTSMLDPRVTANKDVAVDTRATCRPSEEGLASCMGTYVVYCSEGKLYALDCALFIDPTDSESATCGDIAFRIDCGWEN